MRKAIIEKFEELGFTVDESQPGYQVQQYTPAGEDWNLSFTDLQDIKDYAENYDPEEDFNMWIEARQHGVSGVPDPETLWVDQTWKNDVLTQMLNWIKSLEEPAPLMRNGITVGYHKHKLGGYHFCVQYDCCPHWACNSWRTLKRWLKNRNLRLSKKSLNPPSSRKVEGSFEEDYCWSVAELENLKKEKNGFFITVISNGEITKAVSYQENGKTMIVRCNPNVHDRPVYSYGESMQEVRLAS